MNASRICFPGLGKQNVATFTMMRQRLRRFPAAVLAVLFLIAGCAAQTAHPAVQVSLQPLGWTRVPIVDADHEYETGMGARRVVIDHSGKAYVGFLVPQKVELRSRGQANLIFRVAVIDTHTGKTLDVFNFPTRSKRRTSLYLSPHDTLLVVADDRLHLIAHDHRELARFDLLPGPLYLVYQSVTRRTIIADRNAKPGWDDLWYLDSDSLKITKHCVRQVPPIESITDSGEYFEKQNGILKPGEIWKRPFCGAPAMLGEIPKPLNDFYAVSDSSFFEYGDKKIAWAELGKPARFVDTVPGHHYLDLYTFRFSENGNRAAVILVKTRGDSDILDLDGTVVGTRINVYDRVSGSKVGSVWEPVVNRSKQMYWGDYPDFALSPDGKQLVVLYNGSVEVYDLP